MLGKMDDELEVLDIKLSEAHQLKADMMHNLLTEKMRLV